MASVLMKLGVVVILVFDVERPKVFYESLEWRLDAATAAGVVQFTAPGAGCSVQFGGNRDRSSC